MDKQVNQFFYGFIQDTVNLKALTADYNSLMINVSVGLNKIEDKEKRQKELDKRMEEMPQQQKALLLNLLNNMRRVAFSLQTDLNSLNQYLNIDSKTKHIIEENYKNIENTFLPDYNKCKAYLQALNDIKVKNINVESMIITAQKEQQAIESMQTPKGVGIDWNQKRI